MAEYYDRQGRPMTLAQWANCFEARVKDKRVAETTLPNGRWVSTVWLGLNHRYGDGPPLIFETMVFRSKADMSDLHCERYSTEAEALAGHERVCQRRMVEEPEAVAAVDPARASSVDPTTRE